MPRPKSIVQKKKMALLSFPLRDLYTEVPEHIFELQDFNMSVV